MGRASNRKKSQARASSSLGVHERRGSRVVPPLRALGNLRTPSWTKDALPDLLWPCALVTEDDVAGLYLVCKTLDIIDCTLKDLAIDCPSYGLLSQFEDFPNEVRAPVLQALQEDGTYELAFPERFANALALYPGSPGSWLLEPWSQRGINIDTEAAQQYLAPIITACANGRDRVPTRVKFLYVRGQVKAGKLLFPTGMEDALEPLTRYPERVSDDESQRLEAFVRATFLAAFAFHSDDVAGNDVGSEWCRRFWRTNWELYTCIRSEKADVMSSPDRSTAEAVFDAFQGTCRDLRLRFEEVAPRVDPDLFNPDRYEVLTGLVARVVRLAEVAAKAPVLWTSEFGSSLMRAVVEAKIILCWLAIKNDPELYSRFKDYGRGKLKLLKLHMEELVDALDEVPQPFMEYLEQLEHEVNADVWEEFQEISLQSTFSGVTLRSMAIEAKLKSDYDLVFSPTSGVAHGDWTTLNRYSLTRCLNPLHLWHRIPDLDATPLADPTSMETVLEMAKEIIEEYVKVITVQLGQSD